MYNEAWRVERDFFYDEPSAFRMSRRRSVSSHYLDAISSHVLI